MAIEGRTDLEAAELRALLALAEERHFGRAAEALGISQPALSKRLRRLEEQAGGRLVSRGYRDVRLTEPGRVLAEHARTLLRDAELALQASRHALAGGAGRLRIGFGVASIATTLPGVLLRFRRAHPRVQVVMRDMSSPAQLEALRREEIDLGFVRLPVADEALDGVPVHQERLVAALGPGGSWSGKAGLASLAGAPFVVCSRTVSASYYDHVMALCRRAGFAPRIAAETSELFSLLQLVRAGIGVALVPSAAAAMRVPGVAFEAVRLDEAGWQIGLLWRRSPEPAPLVEAFRRVALEDAGAETAPRARRPVARGRASR
jgi:DNA-binding transcriptional LysR family regulator